MSSLLNANNGRVRRAVWLTGVLASLYLRIGHTRAQTFSENERAAEFQFELEERDQRRALRRDSGMAAGESGL